MRFQAIISEQEVKDAPSNCGNGNMLTITLGSEQKVIEPYAKAIALGASSDGELGQGLLDFFMALMLGILMGTK